MIIEQDGTPVGAGQAGGELIKDTDIAGFMNDVIEQSKTVPVIVDFWAPWCGPCKQLTPLLEKLVSQGGGIVKLVKVNVDDNQQLAAQLQVQSVPTVFGFKNGQPVDAFAGAQPESQVKAFIKRLTGDAKAPVEEALDHARELLDQGDAEQASAIYAQVLGQDQANGAAIGGLIRCYIASGEPDHAKALLEGLEAATLNHPEIQAAVSALELAEAGAAGGDLEDLRAKLAANEKDHQARYDLAVGLYGAGRAEEALEELLEIIRRDRGWNEEAARTQMLKIFEALGPTDPITVQARRALSTVLFS